MSNWSNHSFLAFERHNCRDCYDDEVGYWRLASMGNEETRTTIGVSSIIFATLEASMAASHLSDFQSYRCHNLKASHVTGPPTSRTHKSAPNRLTPENASAPPVTPAMVPPVEPETASKGFYTD